MYLKRLELLGFKSFPDKTIIKLTPGVTSIVGPNGCGKTNILDSIRWVLGEQKVSLLRGSKMEEVIFNGTRDVKPLGMAEVTMVVQNNKGVLPTEYGDVQVTRRLFRSGESEYLLNKVPCRLKDISELFMDTGLGAHVYSVIQQDMIEAILSERADDRRFLFEEAAGISKYKNRKKAAIRKLEATESDLIRIKDIVAEINTQVNSLKRQMNKARKYKELTEELKGWELFLGRQIIEDHSRQKRELMSRRTSLTDRKIKFDSLLDSISAGQEEYRKKLIDIDKQLTDIAAQLYEKTEKAHNLETEISLTRERRENAGSLKDKNIQDIEAFKQRKIILSEQIAQTEEELSTLNEELDRTSATLSESEKQLSEADEKVLASRKSQEELNTLLFELERKLTAGKSDDTNLKEQETTINNDISLRENQLAEINKHKDDLLGRCRDLDKKLDELNTELHRSRSEKSSIENEIAVIAGELDDIGGKIFDMSAALEAAEARRTLLEEMMAHYEGFSAGVVAAMDIKDRWPALIGTVADVITPRTGYEEAIETALGDVAGYMICHNRQTAEDIIDYLKAEKKGKAGFLIIDNVDSSDDIKRPELSGEGFVGWADEFISTNDKYRPLSKLLLARTAIIKPSQAEQMIDMLPPFYTAVTTDGKLFQSRAVIKGGSQKDLSLIGRREKIAGQGEIIKELADELEKIKQVRNERTSMLGSKQAELNNSAGKLEDIEEKINQVEKKLTAVNFELQTVNNDITRNEKEKKELMSKLEILKSRQYTLNLNYDQLAKEKESLLSSIKDQEIRTQEMERLSEDAESRFSSLQIEQVEARSKNEQLESRIKHTGELIAEIESNIAAKTEENRQAEIDITEGADKIVELEKQLKAVFDARDELTKTKSEVRQSYDAAQENLEGQESEVKGVRRQRDEAGNELHEIELRITEIDSEMRNVKQNITEQYKIDLEEYAVEIPDSKIPPEEYKNHLHELKERIRDFGGVNMMALEEYEAASERQVFLTAQMEDLLNAKTTLQSTISKINQTAKRLFLETFEKVRQNFSQVFEELFTGGEANIQLHDPEDPLESPIEIIARPRGKKLLSITQMSGGERALTAISLLFSIYLVKPSPFCILDEIDAPLDDANIHRFLKIIRTFSEQTQFIIITHNKITMEAADNLYGITMEQPGISRVVSVRFGDEDDGKLIDTSAAVHYTDDSQIPEAVVERMSAPAEVPRSAGEDDNRG